jgi:hypothetical protein
MTIPELYTVTTSVEYDLSQTFEEGTKYQVVGRASRGLPLTVELSDNRRFYCLYPAYSPYINKSDNSWFGKDVVLTFMHRSCGTDELLSIEVTRPGIEANFFNLELAVGRIYSTFDGPNVLITSKIDESHKDYERGYRFVDSQDEVYTSDGFGATWTLCEDVTDSVLKNVLPGGRTCESDDRFDICETLFKDVPRGFIQWKGTDVCMDVYCKCGYHSHIDQDFCYRLECPKCHTVYVANPYIELIEETTVDTRERGIPKMDTGPIEDD